MRLPLTASRAASCVSARPAQVPLSLMTEITVYNHKADGGAR